jgi:hypothetical protein
MTIHSNFRAFYLPYVLERQKDGRYAVLNRYYKPVGFTTEDFIDYEGYPVTVNLPGLTPRIAASLSCKADTNVEVIYLYNDQSNPTSGKSEMLAYQKKLAMLAKLDAINDAPDSL